MKTTLRENGYLLIAFIPISIYLIGCYLFEMNDQSSLIIKKVILEAVKRYSSTPVLLFEEYKSRLLWLTASLTSIVAYGVALSWSVIVFTRCALDSHRLKLIVAGVLLMSLAMVQSLSIGSESALYNGIFDTTYQSLKISALIDPLTLNHIYGVIWVINFFAVLTPVCILIGITSSIAPPRKPDTQGLVFFKKRIEYLKQGIMVGSLVLLFGIVHMDVWIHWPVALIDDPGIKNLASTTFSLISQFWGIVFSSLLISLYVSGMIYWRSQTGVYLISSQPEIDLKAWFDENGFNFSWQKHALQLSAMLTPFLAGSASTGIDLLSLS